MIVDELVEVTWRGSTNKEYYIDLGYNYTKEFNKLLVSSAHLQPKAEVKVNVLCDVCGKRKNIWMRSYTKNVNTYGKYLCQTCIRELEFKNNHPWATLAKQFSDRDSVLLPQEITHNTQKVQYTCNKHPDTVQTTVLQSFWSRPNSSGCKFCKIEKSADNNRLSYLELFNSFMLCNAILLLDYGDYIDNRQKLQFVCLKHPGVIQYASQGATWQVINDRVHSICRFCKNENKRGEGSTLRYFRGTSIDNWKYKSKVYGNYTCNITNVFTQLVHHLNPFKDIVVQAHKNCNTRYYKNVTKYKTENIVKVSEEIKRLHELQPLGVCLAPHLHTLFHRMYGYYNFTPENYYEFKERYLCGEFEGQL